jgi:hypothetical protein
MEPKGSLSLRKTVSTYLRTKGIKASPESILIVSEELQARGDPQKVLKKNLLRVAPFIGCFLKDCCF